MLGERTISIMKQIAVGIVFTRDFSQLL